jgi:hypothetical protein
MNARQPVGLMDEQGADGMMGGLKRKIRARQLVLPHPLGLWMVTKPYPKDVLAG